MDDYYALLSKHRSSDRTAFIESNGDLISYSQLFSSADALGALLIECMGAGNCTVGIYQPKSIAAVAGIFGVLAAQKAFVPIDPKTPRVRSQEILRNANIRLIIVNADTSDDDLAFFAQQRIAVLVSSRETCAVVHTLLPGSKVTLPPAPIFSQPLSHVLFTSGTTGTPKGVMVKVDSQIAFTRCMAEAFAHNEATRWLSLSPLYFDVCTLDLLVEAYCGSTVVLLQPGVPAHEIVRALKHYQITHTLMISSVIKMVASRHSGIENTELPHLQALWYGGEACPVDALRRLKALFSHLVFAQCYGPTEVCNNSTLYKFDDIPSDITGYMPLGKPLQTVEAYVVDATDTLVIGSGIGELYLGGIQVMAGYVNDTESTVLRLLPNRFNPLSIYPVYRTGDLVRVDDKGLLHFLGRNDDLIKLRGNRVSLHEIQAAIISIPKVVDAIVFVGENDIGGILDSLNAIVILQDASTSATLRKALAEKLPSYMLPDRFHLEMHGEVPIKENGKLDKTRLLNKYATQQSTQ